MRLPKSSLIQRITYSSSPRLGYILIIGAAALAGLVHSIAKPMLSVSTTNIVEIHPLTLAAVIFIINGLFFTPLRRNKAPEAKITRRKILLLALIGIAEVSAIITYFSGLKETTAVNASILANGEIMFSVIVAAIIFREKLQRKEFFPFSLIIAGAAALPVGYDIYQHGMAFSSLVFGDLLVLLSGLFYALDINMSKYASDRIDARRITQITSFVGGGFAIFLIFILQIPYNISLSHIPNIAIIGIFGTGLSTFFFLIALRLIGAIRSILLYSSTSVFGMVFASILLHENITGTNVISIFVVSFGLYLLRQRFGKDEKTINELRGKFNKI
jgi:drug/metabolite transporter (DMT)-like permease